MKRNRKGEMILCVSMLLLTLIFSCPDISAKENEAYAIRRTEVSAPAGDASAEGLSLDTTALILLPGETWDASLHTKIEDGGMLTYKSADEKVASITDKGVVTAKDEGLTEITVSAAADPSVSASLDLLVYRYDTVYTGVKYIEAMGCDIRLRLRLNDDGTFDFYRYPMKVALSGGGVMPDQSESGTFLFDGARISFTSEGLGEFDMDFRLDGEKGAYLQGEMPTGGARTQIQLDQCTDSDGKENGEYAAPALTETGEDVFLTLTMKDGTYRMSGEKDNENETLVSEGTYTLNGSRVEFWAETGANFGADYNAERQVIEGTEIPVTADRYDTMVAVTLERTEK